MKEAPRFIKLQIVPPNTTSGVTIIDCKDGDQEVGYPKETQTDLFLLPGQIVGIVPFELSAADVYVSGFPTCFRVQMTAAQVEEAIMSALVK